MRRLVPILILSLAGIFSAPAFAAASSADLPPFPPALESYNDSDSTDVGAVLAGRIHAEPFNLVATIIFLLAIVHTFLAPKILGFSHQVQHDYEDKLQRNSRPRAEGKNPAPAAPEHPGGRRSISSARSRPSSASG